jgi:hypothetical protein
MNSVGYIVTYLQCIWIRRISLNNDNVAASDFRSNCGLDGGLVTDESEDLIGRIGRKLADELELQSERGGLMSSSW